MSYPEISRLLPGVPFTNAKLPRLIVETKLIKQVKFK